MLEAEVALLLRELHESDTGTMILEPQSIFNRGIIGYDKESNKLRYSYELLAESLAESYTDVSDDEAYSDAIDWLEYNTLGSAPSYPDYPIIESVDYE
tara:strand:- start:215 stop:508 length:294 start_codon:yes stop_codon:yes gene_type:complete